MSSFSRLFSVLENIFFRIEFDLEAEFRLTISSKMGFLFCAEIRQSNTDSTTEHSKLAVLYEHGMDHPLQWIFDSFRFLMTHE
jgi:hypothetical protein